VHSINLNIIDDKLSAYISLDEPKSHFPTSVELIDYLNSRGIVFGILEDCINSMCDKKEPVVDLLIARGEKPRGSLSWEIEFNNLNRPVISTTNKVDFKHLAPLPYIVEGAPLVAFMGKDQIRPGKNIFGQIVSAPVDADTLPGFCADTVEKKENTLYSKETGYLVWADGLLSVSKVFQVQGDVDYSTGNLKINGPVIIEGDVRSGFRVEAEGHITIKGTVDAATVYSQNGDIVIGQGVMGQGRARVMCGGNLICGFAQDAQIAAKKNITLESYAINCTISSGGFVKLTRSNSVIRGGSVTADNGIESSYIGSERGAETELILRSYSENDKQTELWKNSRKKLEIAERRFFLEKRLNFLILLKKDKSDLSQKKENEISDIRTEDALLVQKKVELDKVEARLVKAARMEILKKEIIVHNNIYRNVRIDIGGKDYYTDSTLSLVRIIKIKDEIVVESLSNKYDIFVPIERKSQDSES